MDTTTQAASSFYIDDHAVLYAVLVKNAENIRGEAGNEASIKGTILYARERGLRMAMRCTADGRPLTPRNYLNYGEWVDERKWSDLQPMGLKPFVLRFNRCGWSDTWKKYGLEKYGAVYCRWIDQELVAGFNPENALRIDATRPQGAEVCCFGFPGADYDSGADLEKDAALKAELRPRTVRDFLYHTGHLLSAMRRTYLVELGLPAGGAIVTGGLADYIAHFGQEKADALVEASKQDFLLV